MIRWLTLGRLVKPFPGAQGQGALPHQLTTAGRGWHQDIHLCSAADGPVLQDVGVQCEPALTQLIDGLQSSQGLPHTHQTWVQEKKGELFSDLEEAFIHTNLVIYIFVTNKKVGHLAQGCLQVER